MQSQLRTVGVRHEKLAVTCSPCGRRKTRHPPVRGSAIARLRNVNRDLMLCPSFACPCHSCQCLITNIVGPRTTIRSPVQRAPLPSPAASRLLLLWPPMMTSSRRLQSCNHPESGLSYCKQERARSLMPCMSQLGLHSCRRRSIEERASHQPWQCLGAVTQCISVSVTSIYYSSIYDRHAAKPLGMHVYRSHFRDGCATPTARVRYHKKNTNGKDPVPQKNSTLHIPPDETGTFKSSALDMPRICVASVCCAGRRFASCAMLDTPCASTRSLVMLSRYLRSRNHCNCQVQKHASCATLDTPCVSPRSLVVLSRYLRSRKPLVHAHVKSGKHVSCARIGHALRIHLLAGHVIQMPAQSSDHRFISCQFWKPRQLRDVVHALRVSLLAGHLIRIPAQSRQNFSCSCIVQQSAARQLSERGLRHAFPSTRHRSGDFDLLCTAREHAHLKTPG